MPRTKRIVNKKRKEIFPKAFCAICQHHANGDLQCRLPCCNQVVCYKNPRCRGIREWLKRKPTCPLCKRIVTKLVHSTGTEYIDMEPINYISSVYFRRSRYLNNRRSRIQMRNILTDEILKERFFQILDTEGTEQLPAWMMHRILSRILNEAENRIKTEVDFKVFVLRINEGNPLFTKIAKKGRLSFRDHIFSTSGVFAYLEHQFEGLNATSHEKYAFIRSVALL